MLSFDRDRSTKCWADPARVCEMTLSLAAALLVLVVIMGIARLFARRPRAADLDLVTIRQLEKAGSDLSKVHPVEFFLYVPGEMDARELRRELEATGYAVTLNWSPEVKAWHCLATKPLIVRHGTMLEARRTLAALAARLGGDYDGWGSPVVK
jgi:hypothetical protein